MAKHPSKTIKWKLKTLYNWFYDKWMRLRGFKPYGFDFYNNRNIYMREEEFEAEIKAQEEEPEYEEIFYKQLPSETWYRDKEKDITSKMAVAKALREGKNDARIIRGPLSRS
jgi:hypothetical protein